MRAHFNWAHRDDTGGVLIHFEGLRVLEAAVLQAADLTQQRQLPKVLVLRAGDEGEATRR